MTSPPADGSIKVAIIEDRREIRESLSMLIGGTAGFECVAAPIDGRSSATHRLEASGRRVN
jgi:hypothetical protein